MQFSLCTIGASPRGAVGQWNRSRDAPQEFHQFHYATISLTRRVAGSLTPRGPGIEAAEAKHTQRG